MQKWRDGDVYFCNIYTQENTQQGLMLPFMGELTLNYNNLVFINMSILRAKYSLCFLWFIKIFFSVGTIYNCFVPHFIRRIRFYVLADIA